MPGPGMSMVSSIRRPAKYSPSRIICSTTLYAIHAILEADYSLAICYLAFTKRKGEPVGVRGKGPSMPRRGALRVLMAARLPNGDTFPMTVRDLEGPLQLTPKTLPGSLFALALFYLLQEGSGRQPKIREQFLLD